MTRHARQCSEASVPKEFKAIGAHLSAMCPVENSRQSATVKPELSKTKLVTISYQRIDNEVLNQQFHTYPLSYKIRTKSCKAGFPSATGSIDVESIDAASYLVFNGNRILRHTWRKKSSEGSVVALLTPWPHRGVGCTSRD